MSQQSGTSQSTPSRFFPHSLTADAVLERLDSSRQGLTPEEAGHRLEKYGPNALPSPPAPGPLIIFLRQFLSPLIYILLAAAAVSFLLDEHTDALFIFGVLLINAIIGTIQEYHAHKSAEALRQMVTTSAFVLRGGEAFEVDATELVVGDIVQLESGSKVPADLRLLDGYDLEIDESLLTGESIPVEKDGQVLLDEETLLADRINTCFSGTLVNRGQGRGAVIATATDTAIGRLAESLGGTEAAKPPLMLRMERFTMRITLALGVIVLILAAVELAHGVSWQEMFMVSVALAVSAIPEGLPVALTVTLAIGMNLMARENVIVRRLIAVESLGSCTVIASDKTGTLTMNKLAVLHVALPGLNPWPVTGSSDMPEGAVGIPHEPPLEMEQVMLTRLCQASALCNESFLGLRNNRWVSHGDAVDIALLIMAHKAGVRQIEIQERFPIHSRIPYESRLGFAASLHHDADSPGNHQLFVKGALERLLPMCHDIQTCDGITPLDSEAVLAQANELAAKGYRVLAFAAGHPQPQEDGKLLSQEDLHSLTFLGLVGMMDPLRPEAKESVSACRRAGIRVCMVTGDHPLTAFAIAKELGIAFDSEQVVTGTMLKQADETELNRLVKTANVFARTEPEQKLQIVQAIERQGDFVAVTGDGANDAPALNAAHVGVAMGKRGTDVAKESADIIITDDRFTSIVDGVRLGRVAYQNIRKVIFLLISTGAAEVVLFTLSLAFDLPLPLLAVQLLWLNLVTNGIQDVALAFEKAEGNEMDHPPRRPNEPIFNRMMIERVVISAIAIGVMAFAIFYMLIHAGWSVDSARNSTLLLMVLFENVHVFNSRSERLSAFNHNPLHNRLLLFGTLAAQAIHIAAMYTPGLSSVLAIEPVTLHHWLQLFPAALSILLIMELHKWWRRRHPLPHH